LPETKESSEFRVPRAHSRLLRCLARTVFPQHVRLRGSVVPHLRAGPPRPKRRTGRTRPTSQTSRTDQKCRTRCHRILPSSQLPAPGSRPPVLSSSPGGLRSSVCTTLERQRPQIETSKDAYPASLVVRRPLSSFARSLRACSLSRPNWR
jgi:hypothetical protein